MEILFFIFIAVFIIMCRKISSLTLQKELLELEVQILQSHPFTTTLGESNE